MLNCRPMRLRVFVPPLSRAPLAARLYSSSRSFSVMGNKKTAPCEGSGESLPPLSATEFRAYNRLSEQMDAFVSLWVLKPRT